MDSLKKSTCLVCIAAVVALSIAFGVVGIAKSLEARAAMQLYRSHESGIICLAVRG